ncbi:MAG: tetratricopeptide repeat protein [Nitrospira sp. CR1.1]|nr:tetratricopeptide repeat protein [Nitrospira sp. CR1.1]
MGLPPITGRPWKGAEAGVPWLTLVGGSMLLALTVRSLALYSMSQTEYFETLIIDEQIYHAWAAELAAGTYTSTWAYKTSPLPAYVVGILYMVFHPDPVYFRLLNIGLGTVTCGVLYLLGKEMANRQAGLCSAFLAALYQPFILYSIVPLKTALEVFLFSLTALLLARALTRNGSWGFLLLGLATGLLNATRENTIVFSAIILSLLLWTNLPRSREPLKRVASQGGTFMLGLLLALTPFMVRNYVIAGEPVLTTHQGGFNFYLGNQLDTMNPFYRPVSWASSNADELEIHFRIEASRRLGHLVSPGESERYWIHQAIDSALANPATFAAKQTYKLLALLNPAEAGDHYDIGFLSQFAKFFAFPFPSFGIIMPLGVAGLILNSTSSRAKLGVALLLVGYALALLPFHINGRYRLPFAVILLPFVFICLEHLAYCFRKRHLGRSAACVLLVGLLGATEFIPIPGANDRTAYLNIHAWVLSQAGKDKDALAYWERSSSMDGTFSAFANLSLARHALLHQTTDTALRYLSKISDDSYAAATKHELLGDIWHRQGRAIEALLEYDRSLEINYGKLQVRQKRVAVLEGVDKERAISESRVLEAMRSLYGVRQSKL